MVPPIPKQQKNDQPVRSGPLRADSFANQVFSKLRSRLQHGEIGPGERLVDVEVAELYGVSRMPAREALMRLVHEGYLLGTTRGFVVPQLLSQDIREIFEIRRLLEPRAAAQAAENLDHVQRERLDWARSQAIDAFADHDAEALMLANMAFRSTWLGAVVNRRLAETIGRFVDHVQAVRLATLYRPATQAVVIEGLKGLHDAFMKGDAPLTYLRMESFIARAETEFFVASQERESAGRGQIQPTKQALK